MKLKFQVINGQSISNSLHTVDHNKIWTKICLYYDQRKGKGSRLAQNKCNQMLRYSGYTDSNQGNNLTCVYLEWKVILRNKVKLSEKDVELQMNRENLKDDINRWWKIISWSIMMDFVTIWC